jgi:hypothetical protein
VIAMGGCAMTILAGGPLSALPSGWIYYAGG